MGPQSRAHLEEKGDLEAYSELWIAYEYEIREQVGKAEDLRGEVTSAIVRSGLLTPIDKFDFETLNDSIVDVPSPCIHPLPPR